MSGRDSARAQLARLEALFEKVDDSALTDLGDAILAAARIFVAGRGRSGLVMQAFANRLMHLGVPAAVLGEILAPPVTPRDLLLIGSGSGQTASLVLAANQAHDLGTSVALITGNADSELTRRAQRVVHLPASSPKSDDSTDPEAVHPLGSLFEQAMWITCDSMVLDLKTRLASSDAEMGSRHANIE